MLTTPLPEPWWDLTVDASTEIRVRKTYADELRKECGPDHTLAQREFDAVAKCGGCDHALFAIDGNEWALVHLTWAANEPGWPHVEAVGSWDDVFAVAVEHAQLHQ